MPALPNVRNRSTLPFYLIHGPSQTEFSSLCYPPLPFLFSPLSFFDGSESHFRCVTFHRKTTSDCTSRVHSKSTPPSPLLSIHRAGTLQWPMRIQQRDMEAISVLCGSELLCAGFRDSAGLHARVILDGATCRQGDLGDVRVLSVLVVW